MPRLIAQNLHLNFPIYGRIDPRMQALPSSDRFIVEKGKVKGVKALMDVSFDLAAGQRLAVIGENGSGKTTLLHVLAGLLPPDRGHVELKGNATNLINIQLGLRAEASGHRNITLRGLAAGHNRETIEAARDEIAAFSELGDFLDMPIETYSAGMRMRLSFAIATAFKPDILLLDEWLSTGDAAFRGKAVNRMRSFVDEAGILVLASHSRRLLLDNCNRAIWLVGGRVVEDGPVEEVLNRYEADGKR